MKSGGKRFRKKLMPISISSTMKKNQKLQKQMPLLFKEVLESHFPVALEFHHVFILYFHKKYVRRNAL